MNKTNVINVANKVSSIASSMESKVLYFLLLSTISASFIAWQWIDFNTIGVVTIAKALLLAVPLLLWTMLWLLLKQLTGLPEQINELKLLGEESIETASKVSQGTATKRNIFSSLFQLFNTLREPEILQTIFLCTRGIGLIINPFALLALFIFALMMIGFILTALLIIIF